MGRAFNKLQKTVSGRRAEYDRPMTVAHRVRQLEVFALELASYMVAKMDTIQGDDADSNHLVEASADFRKHLEKVIR